MELKSLTNTPIDSSNPQQKPSKSAKTRTHIHDEGEHDRENRGTPHFHSEESLRQIVNRLSRIEGHIRGIKTMVAENKPCPEVLLQIAAVRGALDRVARLILDEHLSECIVRAAKEGTVDTELEYLKAALDRFLPR